MLYKLRFWLLKKIAGSAQVAINLTLGKDGNCISAPENSVLFGSNVVMHIDKYGIHVAGEPKQLIIEDFTSYVNKIDGAVMKTGRGEVTAARTQSDQILTVVDMESKNGDLIYVFDNGETAVFDCVYRESLSPGDRFMLHHAKRFRKTIGPDGKSKIEPMAD